MHGRIPPHARRIGTAAIAIVAMLLAASARQVRGADAAPYFLVATREIPDSIFAQSVVLILPSTDIPIVVGVIINKPTTLMLRELFPKIPGIKDQSGVAYLGGPVDPEMPALLFRTSEPPANAARILRDIYISSDRKSLAVMLAKRDAIDLRLIVGRAQWTRDQLRAEISEGAWYVVPAEPELIFSEPRKLWRLLVERGQLQEVESTLPAAPPGRGMLRAQFSHRQIPAD